jgi:hypothetical protein
MMDEETDKLRVDVDGLLDGVERLERIVSESKLFCLSRSNWS